MFVPVGLELVRLSTDPCTVFVPVGFGLVRLRMAPLFVVDGNCVLWGVDVVHDVLGACCTDTESACTLAAVLGETCEAFEDAVACDVSVRPEPEPPV